LSYSGTESTAWSGPTLADFGVSGRWEDLSAVERGRVANHYLIGSGTAASFGDLKLPVVNPKTGKLNERALRAVIGGRGAAVGGVSAEQRSAARRRAYRLLNSEFDAGLTVPETLEEEKLLSMDGYTIAAIADNEQGYRELTQNVQSQLDRMDNDTKVHFLQEMYGDYFIYEARSREGGSQLFKQTYQTGDDGSVQFTGVPTEVRKKIEYIAMKSGSGLTRTKFNNNKEEVNTMSKQNDGKTPCCLAKVEQLISNEKTPWTDKDKEWLLAQEEDIIDKLIPTEEPAVDETKKQPVVQAKVEPVTAEQAMKVLKDSVSKPDDFFKILPEELRGSMQAGLKLYNEQRARMIKDIMANAKDVWTEDELKKMDNNALSKTHKAVVREEYDYSGLGSAIETNEQEALLPPGVGVEKKEDKK